MFAVEPTPPMKARTTAQNVYELLRHEIVLNILKPLEAIREGVIAERLGVSRTPVREALLRLSNMGLVDIYPQSGTRVAPIRIEKVRAAQLIREAVEVDVVSRACETASDAGIDKVASLIEDQIVAAGRNDLRRLFELDEAFHRAIFAAAGFAFVSDELDDVKVHLDRLRYVSVNWPRGADNIVREHQEILAGLRARNSEAAARAMRQHLRAVLIALDIIMRGSNEPPRS